MDKSRARRRTKAEPLRHGGSVAVGAGVVLMVLTGCTSTTAGDPSAAAGSAVTAAPSQTLPTGPASESASTERSSPGSIGSLPSGTEPSGTEPSGTEPSGTDPAGTDPAGTEPSASSPDTGAGRAPISGSASSSSATDSSDTRSTTESSTATTAAGPETGGAPNSGQASLDLRSIDPCSFFNERTFDSVAKDVVVSLSYAEYDGCHLKAVGKVKKQVWSWSVGIDMGGHYPDTGALRDSKPGSYTTGRRAGVATIEGTTDDGDCIGAFQLPGGFATAVITVSSKTDPCPAAIAALTDAVQAVADGRLTPIRWPAGSLAGVDLCSRFRSAATEALAGTATPQPIGLHTCLFQGKGGQQVTVNFAAARWPPLGLDDSADTVTVAGHQVRTRRNSANGSFLIIGAIRLGSTEFGLEGSWDVVMVFAGGQGDGADRTVPVQRLLATAVG